MFCQVEPGQVLAVQDVASTYCVPGVLKKQSLITFLAKILLLDRLKIYPELVLEGTNTWDVWQTSTSQESLKERVTIALVGEYTSFADSKLSVIDSLEHCAMASRRKLKLSWSSHRTWKMIADILDQQNTSKHGKRSVLQTESSFPVALAPEIWRA